jgi:hypothetical protein
MSGTDSVNLSNNTHSGSSADCATPEEKADFLRALADIIEDGGCQSSACEDPIILEDVNLGWHGDPHGHGEGTVNGTKTDFKILTIGGAGEEINWLEADKSGGNQDDLSITSEFISWGSNEDITVAGDTTVTVGNDEIMVDPGASGRNDSVISVNGTHIKDCDLADGYHVTDDGTKVTKDGDTITIETADGDKVVLKDRGTYLDASEVSLADGKYEELGGILGDALTGNLDPITDANGEIKRSGEEVHVDATQYAVEGDSPSASDCNTEQGQEWATEMAELLRTLAPLMEDSKISALLTSTAALLSAGSIDSNEEIVNYLQSVSAIANNNDDAELLSATADAIGSGDINNIVEELSVNA